MLDKHGIMVVHERIVWISSADHAVDVVAYLFLHICLDTRPCIEMQTVVATVGTRAMIAT